MTGSVPVPTLRLETADAGRIRLGAGFKMPPAHPAAVADAGKIRLGAGFKRRIAAA